VSSNWQIQPSDLMATGPLVPVLVINDVAHALPIAEALLAADIKVLEITLRTEAALGAIETIAKNLPEAIVGSGTVTNRRMLQQSADAGSQFAISPGLTSDLLAAGKEGNVALLPGISTISELMTGLDHGYDHFKFFPAESNGGPSAIKSIGGPLPNVRFCPTGGISLNNIKNYLALSNVMCCGGSWLVTPEIVANKDWAQITKLAKESLAYING
jgi:2-dehydro-3-deoxyphosphogluconate aldolase/(4S)-4-hydroxy-2-oxoglutarate aldolase